MGDTQKQAFHKIGDVVLFPKAGRDAAPFDPPKDGDVGWTLLDLESEGCRYFETEGSCAGFPIIGLGMRSYSTSDPIIFAWTSDFMFPIAQCPAGMADGVMNAMFQLLCFTADWTAVAGEAA